MDLSSLESNAVASIHPIQQFFNLHPALLHALFHAQSTGKTAQAVIDEYIQTLEESQSGKRNDGGDIEGTRPLEERTSESSAHKSTQNDKSPSTTSPIRPPLPARESDMDLSTDSSPPSPSPSNPMPTIERNRTKFDETPVVQSTSALDGIERTKREMSKYPTDEDLEFCTTLLVENISPSLDLEELANIFNYYVEITPLSMYLLPPIGTHKTAILWLDFETTIDTRAAWVILDGYRTHGKGMIPKLRMRDLQVEEE